MRPMSSGKIRHHTCHSALFRSYCTYCLSPGVSLQNQKMLWITHASYQFTCITRIAATYREIWNARASSQVALPLTSRMPTTHCETAMIRADPLFPLLCKPGGWHRRHDQAKQVLYPQVCGSASWWLSSSQRAGAIIRLFTLIVSTQCCSRAVAMSLGCVGMHTLAKKRMFTHGQPQR